MLNPKEIAEIEFSLKQEAFEINGDKVKLSFSKQYVAEDPFAEHCVIQARVGNHGNHIALSTRDITRPGAVHRAVANLKESLTQDIAKPMFEL